MEAMAADDEAISKRVMLTEDSKKSRFRMSVPEGEKGGVEKMRTNDSLESEFYAETRFFGVFFFVFFFNLSLES